jgi:hypothetical protein
MGEKMGLFILIIHLLFSLLAVVAVVYTLIQVIHRYNMTHMFNKIEQRMRPLIMAKGTRKHIVDSLTLDGFPKDAVEEMYEKLTMEMALKR